MNRREFVKIIFGLPLIFARPFQAKASNQANASKVLLLETVIAGFNYYEGEKIWYKLRKDNQLSLLREPENLYDEKAVAIYWQDKKLGYIPSRVDNSVIAQLMDKGNHLEAYITWLNKSCDPWERIGIKVELKMGKN